MKWLVTRQSYAVPNAMEQKIVRHEKTNKTVYDLKFCSAGLRRWVAKHCYYRYYCYHCDTTFYSHPQHWTSGKFGQNLIAYVIYQNIGMRLPQEVVANSLNELFGFDLQLSVVHDRKIRAAQYYQLTYQRILDNIVHGKLVHADETKVSIKGQVGYVWVVTDLEAVAYFYTETRDGDKIQALLKDFMGVLVSDFYAAYDSINCPQQKCLIHLMRDLNDELRKEPFNEELKQLVREFALLLKPMVETVDRFGLKAHYLREHKIFVERFYTRLSKSEYKPEIAIKYKKRFEKNHDELFTFLDYDDVPWNNNNAEHAIKAFATLRKVVGGTSTDKGIREYLTPLSISETCKYKGVSFLEFLRSGEKDIDVFIEGLGPGELSHGSPSQGYDV